MDISLYEKLLQQVNNALLRAVSADDSRLEMDLLRLKAEILRDMRSV